MRDASFCPPPPFPGKVLLLVVWLGRQTFLGGKMRKSKQNKHKRLYGTNLKVSPLKKFKKIVKRMKNRLKGLDNNPESIGEKRSVYMTRLERAENELKNWEKNQEQKKADAFKAAALAKKAG